MSIMEIKARVDQLGSAWESFKSINDKRLSEIEKKGDSDVITDTQLKNVNDTLNEYKNRLDGMEVALNRSESPINEDILHSNYLIKQHKNVFTDYLRKGIESNLSEIQTKALSVGSDSDGGYLVSPSMSNQITKAIFETSPMRKIASVESISSDVLEIIEDKDEAAAGWTSETGSIAETNTPEIAKKTISTHELYAQPKATQKLIDDAYINIESWLADKVADVFSRKENTAFINGDGVGKPKGILSYNNGTNWGEIEQLDSGVDGVVTADKLVELFYSLKENYSVKAEFLMNRASVEQIRLLKGSNGQYLWNPGLSQGAPDTLLGVNVHQAADMPSPAIDSLSIAIADFKSAYKIVDRTGVRVLRDPFTEKPFVKFYSTKRVGGDVTNFEAIKLMKLSS